MLTSIDPSMFSSSLIVFDSLCSSANIRQIADAALRVVFLLFLRSF